MEKRTDLSHVNEDYMRKMKTKVEKFFDLEGLIKMCGGNMEAIDEMYPGYSSYVKGMMNELSSIMDEAVDYAIAQDMLSNRQHRANQLMVGMLEKQRRQMILMDAKLDILLGIKEEEGDRT